jgi:starch synthase (maltosyl-transferring)
MTGRIPILDVQPVVGCGRWSAKAAVGETFTVSATIFREGHDAVGANVVLRDSAGRKAPWLPMWPLPPGEGGVPAGVGGGTDRWVADVTPTVPGRWTFAVEAWSDPIATWHHNAGIKVPAGVDVETMLEEGARLLERAARAGQRQPAAKRALLDAAAALRDQSRPAQVRLAAADDDAVVATLQAVPLRELVTSSERMPLWVDRERALYGSWYEFFPRSEGARVDPGTGTVSPGTLATAAERLPAVAGHGLRRDLPPADPPDRRGQPQGTQQHPDPGPGRPGLPWAIGSKHGGHDAIHPELGTEEDFEKFVARAHEVGLEVALDLALQCAPDHPWVTEHPEWFTVLVDGTIAYAENPPKKYQDIYPVNFDRDPKGIYAEVLRIVRLWMDRGVRIFRVDNPHTKPVDFWEWLLTEVRKTDPDVLFLAEAFTRPPMMHTLAKVGFHQSYSYFTWRTGKQEIQEYGTGPRRRVGGVHAAELLREHPGHPARLPAVRRAGRVQDQGCAGFDAQPDVGRLRRLRALRARGRAPGQRGVPRLGEVPGARARLGRGGARGAHAGAVPHPPEHHPARAPGPAAPAQPALPPTDTPAVLCYSKHEGSDIVIVVVNLDPHGSGRTLCTWTSPRSACPPGRQVAVRDEITGQQYTWGEHNYVRLDPFVEPAHILTVRSTSP